MKVVWERSVRARLDIKREDVPGRVADSVEMKFDVLMQS